MGPAEFLQDSFVPQRLTCHSGAFLTDRVYHVSVYCLSQSLLPQCTAINVMLVEYMLTVKCALWLSYLCLLISIRDTDGSQPRLRQQPHVGPAASSPCAFHCPLGPSTFMHWLYDHFYDFWSQFHNLPNKTKVQMTSSHSEHPKSEAERE